MKQGTIADQTYILYRVPLIFLIDTETIIIKQHPNNLTTIAIETMMQKAPNV
jgi:hypothetical protein